MATAKTKNHDIILNYGNLIKYSLSVTPKTSEYIHVSFNKEGKFLRDGTTTNFVVYG